MRIKKSSKSANRSTHKKKNLNKEKYITTKANNTNSIRVLYKKTGQVPEVRIIDNVFRLKKAIVKKNLDIIPYETVYIICTNKKKQDKTKEPNIVLDFYSITGDLILIDIDPKEREFKGLSQEDIIWYTHDLINKSFSSNNVNTFSKPISKINRQNAISYNERVFDNSNITNFEQLLLQVLKNIELILSSILKNDNGSEGFKYEWYKCTGKNNWYKRKI